MMMEIKAQQSNSFIKTSRPCTQLVTVQISMTLGSFLIKNKMMNGHKKVTKFKGMSII